MHARAESQDTVNVRGLKYQLRWTAHAVAFWSGLVLGGFVDLPSIIQISKSISVS